MTPMMKFCLYAGILFLSLPGIGFFFNPVSCFGAEDLSERNVPAVVERADDVDDDLPAADEPARKPQRTVTLTGMVTDLLGRPVPGAAVALSGAPFVMTSADDKGAFSLIAEDPLDPLSLEIFKEGYFPLYVPVLPEAENDTGPMVFKLSPLPDLKVFSPAPEAPAAGSGMVHVEAEELSYEYDTDTYHARRNVTIQYTEGVLTAEKVDIHYKKNEAVAEGQVVIKSRDGDVIDGEKVYLDIEKKTGIIEKGKIFVAKTHFYVAGGAH